MALYRSKPVVIEAVQWWGKYRDGDEWPDWFRNAWDTGRLNNYLGGPSLSIAISEGTMIASVGDYIIRSVRGNICACKPHIFDSTYESVESGRA